MEVHAPEVLIPRKPANECWSCSFRRRALLVFFVALTLWLTQGCAAYETKQPMAERGTVTLTWEVNPSRVPGNHCGWAEQIARGHYLITFRRIYDFNEPCWPHELQHAMGGSHQ